MTRRQRLAEYFKEHDPQQIGRFGWLIVGGLLLIAGLPSLWAPFDGDQSLFFVSGQKILAGDVLYRDILDLKPPLIYFIYACSIGIFGESLFAVRLVELLVHGGVLWILVRTLRRVSGNDALGLIAGLCYAALYFSLPFYSRGQVEGFANLPLVVIFASLVSWKQTANDRRLLLVGVMTGILLLLKTSFLVLLPTIGVLFLFDSDVSLKRWFKRMTLTGLGALPPLVLFFLYLWSTDSSGDFALVQEFTRGYAAVQWSSVTVPLTEAIRQIPWYFATTYSVVLSLLTVVGMFVVIFPAKKGNVGSDEIAPSLIVKSAGSTVLRFALLAFLVLLATVAVEAKYLTWHFNRVFVPGAILAAWGAVAVLRRILGAPHSSFTVTMGIACLIPVLLLSPLVRYGWNSRASLVNATSGVAAFNTALGMDGDGFDLAELQTVGTYLKTHREPADAIFVASGWGGAVHFFAGDVPAFKVYQSGFLIAPYAPKEWRQGTRAWLLEEKPRFIVAQHDAMPHITGNDTTSLEMLRALPGIDSLLQSEYSRVLETAMTEVYERRSK